MAKYFGIPFADSGDKEAIPDESVNTLVSYETGYTPEYELDPDTDPNGNYVGRQRFNQLGYDMTSAIKEIQERGFKVYAADVNYPVGAITQGSDGNLYQAESANGPATSVVDPVGDTTGTWVIFLSSKSGTVQVDTPSSGTFALDPLAKTVEIIAVGAGGGSGAVVSGGAGTSASSVAGSGGAYCHSVYDRAQITSDLTIVRGAGGGGAVAGGSPAAAGGDTTVSATGITTMTAGGGSGGASRVALSGTAMASGAQGGVAAGSSVHNVAGGSTPPGGTFNGMFLTPSPGGSSYFGSAGRPGLNSSADSQGVWGVGGSAVSVTETNPNQNGSNGGNGRIIIRQYF